MMTQTTKKVLSPPGKIEKLEYINLVDPKLYLQWYMDKHRFIKVNLIKVHT